MKKRTWLCMLTAVAALSVARYAEAASHAYKVIEFVQGDNVAASFSSPEAALGAPARTTGQGVFPGVVSAFNPAYMPNEIVAIGEGGTLTLKLSNYIIPSHSGLDLGIFTNVGLIDQDYPNGQAQKPLNAATGSFSADSIVFEVSANGVDWETLGEKLFDVPTIGYSDVTDPYAIDPGSVESDFGKPYAGTLEDMAGLKYSDASAPDILDLVDGSGGGKWLDLSPTQLSFIGWLRFTMPNDNSPDTQRKFELDAVSIATQATGPAVPEPSALALLVCGAMGSAVVALRRKK